MRIAAFTVRQRTMFTALDAARQIDKISPALIPQRVQWTIAKQAVKTFPHPLVTGKILTFPIAKILIAVFHSKVPPLFEKAQFVYADKSVSNDKLRYSSVFIPPVICCFYPI